MAVPSSGQLRLRGDIALEVDGVATGINVSLRTLSASAGFSTPDNMSEFYGYTSAVAPSATTNSITSISETSMTLNGNITSDGGATIIERGFYLGTNSASPTNNTKYVVGGTTGSYSTIRAGLASGTTYYCWAFATNSAGTTYGARTQANTIQSFSPSYAEMYVIDTDGQAYASQYTGLMLTQVWKYYKNPYTGSWVQFGYASEQNYGFASLYWYHFSPSSLAHQFATNTQNMYSVRISGWSPSIGDNIRVGGLLNRGSGTLNISNHQGNYQPSNISMYEWANSRNDRVFNLEYYNNYGNASNHLSSYYQANLIFNYS